MKKVNVGHFEKETLIDGLKEALPHYLVRAKFGNLQVRTSGFTVTGNVNVKMNPKKGVVATQTNLDSVVIYMLFCWPLGLYVLSKKGKQKRMEQEVLDKIKTILKPEKVAV